MTHKVRYVADGHLTDDITYMNYSSFVIPDAVHIGLLIAAFKNLDVLAGYIKNAFLEALDKEKFLLCRG